MLSWLMITIAVNFLADVVLSSGRNASVETMECTPSHNATGRVGVDVCKITTGARGHDKEPSYSMLIQAAYGLTAITVLVVAYFIFRTMRFVLTLNSVIIVRLIMLM